MPRARRLEARPGRTSLSLGYLEQWRNTTLPRRGLSPSTEEQYRNLIATPLTPTLGKVRLSRFDAAEVERWLGRLEEARSRGRTNRTTGKVEPGKILSQSTKRSAFAVLSLAMDTAVRDGLIITNPLADVRRPRTAQAEMPVLTAEQIDDLIAASAGTDIEALLIFVANTGVRLGEALSLRWDDTDLDVAQATIRRSGLHSDRTKTAAGRRAVPLLPEVVSALEAERQTQETNSALLGSGWGDSGLVFPSLVGTPLDPISPPHVAPGPEEGWAAAGPALAHAEALPGHETAEQGCSDASGRGDHRTLQRAHHQRHLRALAGSQCGGSRASDGPGVSRLVGGARASHARCMG